MEEQRTTTGSSCQEVSSVVESNQKESLFLRNIAHYASCNASSNAKLVRLIANIMASALTTGSGFIHLRFGGVSCQQFDAFSVLVLNCRGLSLEAAANFVSDMGLPATDPARP